MASSVPTAQGLKLKCPSCFKQLTEPKALDCSHFFCQNCIDEFKTVESDLASGIQCPICDTVTAKDKVQTVDCIQELLKVATKDKAAAKKMCDKCNTNIPIWRCHDCKEDFCDTCYSAHNGFSFLSNHYVEKLSDTTAPVYDKHVRCERHPKKIAELHCKDCSVFICVLCNGSEHKTHQTDTIDEAVERVKPVMKENIEELNKKIGRHEQILGDTIDQAEAIKKGYEDMESQAEKKCTDIIQRAREDCKKIKQELQEAKDEECNTIDSFCKRVESKIQCQKNIVAIGESSIDSAKGTCLLQLYQVTFGTQTETVSKGNNKITEYVPDKQITLVETDIQKANLIGTVQRKSKINATFTDISKKNPVLEIEIELGGKCIKTIKVDNEFLVLKYRTNTIEVYSTEGKKVRTTKYDELRQINSLAKWNSEIAIAAKNGCYIANKKGTIEFKVVEGNFCDVSVVKDLVLLLDNDKAKVIQLRLDGKGHETIREIQIPNHQKNDCNSMQATGDKIYVALCDSNKIFQFDYSGKLQKRFESCRPSIGIQLEHITLCGADNDGSILMTCTSQKHGLVILTSDGKWIGISITGLKYPHGAFVENTQISIGDCDTGKLHVYRFE